MAKALSRRSQVAYKAQTSYAETDVSGSGFTVVEAAIPQFTPGTELFPVESIRSGHFRIAPIVGGTYGGTLTLSFPLQGLTTAVPSAGTTPTADFLAIILRQLLGSQAIQASTAVSTITTWETGAPIEVANSPASTTYKVGGAIIGKVTGPTIGYEMAIISAVEDGGVGTHSLNTLNTLEASAKAGTDEVWGCIGSYITKTGDAELGASDALSITIQGMNTTSYLVLGGCVAQSLKLPLSPRANPMVEVVFSVCDVREGLTGAAISTTAYTAPRVKPITKKNGGRLLIGSAIAELQSLDLEIATTWAPCNSHNYRQGVSGLVATDRVARLTYTTLVTGAVANLETLTHPSKILAFWGSQPGQMFGVAMPNPVVVGLADLKDDNGIWAQTVTVEPGQYGGDNGSDAPTNSPFRFYQG